MSYLEAIILAIIEGITEFLPVSSTGHMIIGSSFMGIAEDEFTKTFTVAIQFGAILSVIVLYWKRFFQSVDFYLKLFVAFIPAAIFGFLLDDYIDAMLGNVLIVGYSLFWKEFYRILYYERVSEYRYTEIFSVREKTQQKYGFLRYFEKYRCETEYTTRVSIPYKCLEK